MSPDRRFLTTTAFPHYGSGKIARSVLSEIEIATWKASSAPSRPFDVVVPLLTIV